MEAEERLLIEEAQKGDLASFEALVKKYDKQVLSLAYNLINDTEDAKDIYIRKSSSASKR